MATRIGFVGLGVMGTPMAGHLAQAGHALTVLDLDPGKANRLAAAHSGVRVAATPREVAENSEVVITMLPSGEYVRDVAVGKAGLIEGFKGGELLIDTSSCEPWLTVETAKKLAAKGVAMVDAATSGAEFGAQAATLVFMVGGEPKAIERASAVLNIMGKHVFHLGPIGAGHAMKSINNTITAMTLTATAEGLVLGKKLGLDPNVMTDVLNVSTGMSWITQTHIKQRITNRAFDDPFKLELMVKDIRIAMQLAEREGTNVPLWERGQQIWKSADEMAGSGASVSELVRYVERQTGVEIAP
ncbi:MAG TPA: NAD(P)-dependent oxidoreductase [Gammaproteobacteria bacterium]|nr:NAD(P)-dependent oxidoreductase [Gammaproteobacteria bacterium]